MLRCSFVYAVAMAMTKIQLPFTQLEIVPEIGSIWPLSQHADRQIRAEGLCSDRSRFSTPALPKGQAWRNECPALGEKFAGDKTKKTCSTYFAAHVLSKPNSVFFADVRVHAMQS